MNLRSRYVFPALLLGALASFAAPSARAQAAPRIGIANPAKIFEDMEERKDAQSALDAHLNRLRQEDQNKKGILQKLKEDVGQLKAGTPQYDAKNAELLKGAIEYDVWARMVQADAGQQQKTLMVRLYQKIQAAVAEVAKKQGFDLVLTEQVPEIPADISQIDPNQLRALINTRNVLFNKPDNGLDLTQAVILQLNADYKKAPQPK